MECMTLDLNTESGLVLADDASITGLCRKLSGATPTPVASDGTTAAGIKTNGKADELSPTAHPKTPQPQNELVGRRVKVPAGLHVCLFKQLPATCRCRSSILLSNGCRHREGLMLK